MCIRDRIGTSEYRLDLMDEYVYFFRKNFDDSIDKYMNDNFVVGIDTANGATYQVAEKVFKALGIKYKIINNNPDGININQNCGSTHLENLKKFVVENKLNLGIAYDGDGDRCLAVDENGNEIDGDKLLAIISTNLRKKGKLNKDTIVATVMSNLGLNKFARDNGLELLQTKVGDRYVLEEMLKDGFNLGGEQDVYKRQKQNGGLSDARNYGMKFCTCKLITFIDSDDYISKDYIKNLYELMLKYNADISCTNYINFYEDNSFGKKIKHNRQKVFSSQDAIIDVLYQKNIANSAWGLSLIHI